MKPSDPHRIAIHARLSSKGQPVMRLNLDTDTLLARDPRQGTPKRGPLTRLQALFKRLRRSGG